MCEMIPSPRSVVFWSSVHGFMYAAFFLTDVSPFSAPYNNEYSFVLYILPLSLL
jgi:hypothetical protein